MKLLTPDFKRESEKSYVENWNIMDCIVLFVFRNFC